MPDPGTSEVPSSPDSDGYNTVLMEAPDGAPQVQRVDELVLETFVGPRPPGHQAEHINGDRGDDRAVNLRWVLR